MLAETWKMKPPIKYQEMKITISKMKNTLYGINSRFKIAKENSSELEDNQKAIEQLKPYNKTQRQKGLKKNYHSISETFSCHHQEGEGANKIFYGRRFASL